MKKRNLKLSVIVMSIVLGVIAMTTATYALYTNEIVAEKPNEFKTGLLSIEATSKTETISLTSALPVDDEEGLKAEPYVFTITNIGNLDYKFKLELLATGDTTSETVINPGFIKLQVDDGEVVTLLESRGILKEDVTLKVGESMDISLKVWLSKDITNDQIGRTFTSKIVADGQAVYTESNNGIPITMHINNIFKPNNKVTNNNIEYDIDTKNQLIKDTDGNIRYYGSDITYDVDNITKLNEIENYIYFNCDDYNNQSSETCELWRIIGIVDNKIKLIKNTNLGELTLDYDYNNDKTLNTYDSNFNNSTLNTMLNSSYLNNEDTIYYNYSTSGPVKNELNFNTNKTGIKDNSKDLIEESSNTIVELNNIDIYPNELLELENNQNNEVFTSKVSIPTVTDYIYSSDLNICNNKINELCTANWMNDIFNNSNSSWLLTNNLVHLNNEGKLIVPSTMDYNTLYNSGALGVNPVVYLKSDIKLDSGAGTISYPYRILVK